MLLTSVRGPTSFEDLKTVNSRVCSSFQEACIEKGLIEQEHMANKCMEEATTVHMPDALSRLFVTLLVFAEPPKPTFLWEKYYAALSEDFTHSNPSNDAYVLSRTVDRIEQLLENMRKKMTDYGLEHLKQTENDVLRMTRDIRDVLEAPFLPEHLIARKQLNVEHRLAYKAIIKHVKQNLPGAFFIDGPGGTS